MNKVYKDGNGNKITINNNTMTCKKIFTSETFTIDDIEDIRFIEPEDMNAGYLTITTHKNEFKLRFSTKQREELYLIYSYLYDHFVNTPSCIYKNATIYRGGHPQITNVCYIDLLVCTTGITIKRNSENIFIPYSQIIDVKTETQEQVTSRYSATRLFLWGIFALAFKKKDISFEKYLTIDFTNEAGLNSTMIFSGYLCGIFH